MAPRPPKTEVTVPVRPYVKADTAPAPVPEPLPIVWALAIVPMKRMGQVEHNVVAVQIQGDRVLKTAVVPESNWETMDQALYDLRMCAQRIYRFKQIDSLLAGRA